MMRIFFSIITAIVIVIYLIGYQPSITYSHSISRSKVYAAKIRIEHLETAILTLYLDIKRYPTTEEGLELLISDKGESHWCGPYLEKNRIPIDLWGNKFVYYFPPKHGNKKFDIYSFGADGKDDFGKNDDISNWSEINEDYYDKKANDENIFFYMDILMFLCVSIALIRTGKPSLKEISLRFAKLLSVLLVLCFLISLPPNCLCYRVTPTSIMELFILKQTAFFFVATVVVFFLRMIKGYKS